MLATAVPPPEHLMFTAYMSVTGRRWNEAVP